MEQAQRSDRSLQHRKTCGGICGQSVVVAPCSMWISDTVVADNDRFNPVMSRLAVVTVQAARTSVKLHIEFGTELKL
jgi:hypothetical protein